MWKWIVTCIGLAWPCLVGAQDTRFETAIEDWLADKDEVALPALAELAQQGHGLARILLAQIEVKDRGHSPFRAGLSPAEARAVFRRDVGYGGFSKSWLAIEAEAGAPLATALLATRHPRPDASLLAKLRRLGELEATDYPLRVIALYGTEGEKRTTLNSDLMLDELRPFFDHHINEPIWRGEGIAALNHIAPFARDMISESDPEVIEMAGLLALGIAAGETAPTNRWRGLVENWILTAPATRPIAEICRTQCAHEVTGCAFAVFALSGGYYEVIRLDTPLESVIAQDRFLASPRARLMTLRRAALAKHNANRAWLASEEQIAAMSQCAANLVGSTRAEYE